MSGSVRDTEMDSGEGSERREHCRAAHDGLDGVQTGERVVSAELPPRLTRIDLVKYSTGMEIASLISFLRLTTDQTFEARKQIVSLVTQGKTVESVARAVPFTARTIYRWVARFALGGFRGFKDRKKAGRPRKWTAEHAEWIYKVVVDQTPQQCKFDFALTTTNRLRQAFHQEFGVRISQWTVRRILRSLGLTPQRPKRRATKYNPGDMARGRPRSSPVSSSVPGN